MVTGHCGLRLGVGRKVARGSASGPSGPRCSAVFPVCWINMGTPYTMGHRHVHITRSSTPRGKRARGPRARDASHDTYRGNNSAAVVSNGYSGQIFRISMNRCYLPAPTFCTIASDSRSFRQLVSARVAAFRRGPKVEVPSMSTTIRLFSGD